MDNESGLSKSILFEEAENTSSNLSIESNVWRHHCATTVAT